MDLLANPVQRLRAALDDLEYPLGCKELLLEEYRNVRVYYKEVDRVEVGVHYGRDGGTKKCAKIGGVVGGVAVWVWLGYGYPVEPPVCYVMPTETTVFVRGHPKVESGGRVVMDWEKAYTLTYLFGMLVDWFLQEPPLKPKWKAEVGRVPRTVEDEYLLRGSVHRKLVKMCHNEVRKGEELVREGVRLNNRVLEMTEKAQQSLNEVLSVQHEIALLEAQISDFNVWIAQNGPKAAPTPSTLIPTDPLSTQILTTTALINTIDDELHLLSLTHQPPDSLVRSAISLGREKFLSIALLNKMLRIRGGDSRV
eukprot:TRINITY_DN8016_c0_g1_i1.p1 TRINITY_DN8016_c0_g1~~TRINITY_DN8016_c0_g1_i1.p1  ORF type:complete len:309 (+),score=24.24 TRINITY_DN8016_c0_g1_i1:509-1435(+)